LVRIARREVALVAEEISGVEIDARDADEAFEHLEALGRADRTGKLDTANVGGLVNVVGGMVGPAVGLAEGEIIVLTFAVGLVGDGWFGVWGVGLHLKDD